MISYSQQSRPRFFFSSLAFLLIFILNGCDLLDNGSQNTPNPDQQTQDGTDDQQPNTDDNIPVTTPSPDTPSQDGTDDQQTQDGADNQPPIASISTPDPFSSGQTVTLNGSGSSDPDGDTLSYLWTQTEGANIVLSNSSSANLTFVAPVVAQATQFTFQLTVNDGELSNSANVSVQISPTVDSKSPSIVSRSPQPDQSGVSTTAEISVGFDEALLETSIDSQSFSLSQNGNPVSGVVSYDSANNTINNKPAAELTPDTTYTVTLADTLEDLAGNAFAGESWSFSTGAADTNTGPVSGPTEKTRVIVTTDGEIDDRCSLTRFLLYANEWDIEGIISSSSQYHWQGHNWAGDDWQAPYLDAYEKVYPNLVKHDPEYPTPEYIRAQSHLGNVKKEGDMDEPSEGSDHIVKALLDASDNRPIWLQAWGGVNTIARALKTIEEDHPDRMDEVAAKLRFYFIWEQDSTYQDYIRKSWGKYNIPTIISDQFITFGYWWEDWDFPDDMATYFKKPWFTENLLDNHGPLLSLYEDKGGAFRSEGDSPSYLHAIPTGLRNLESPGWGGWGGRYVKVRENTWLDPVPVEGYKYPSGRWYTSSAWGRKSLRDNSASQEQYREYFKPITRWIDVIQNDFAARADWCVMSYAEANHEPMVKLGHTADLTVEPGATVALSAQGTSDPDGDALTYHWWHYTEAGTYNGNVEIQDGAQQDASFVVPEDAGAGQTIHIVLEVTDSGSPPLTRYQRVVATVGQ